VGAGRGRRLPAGSRLPMAKEEPSHSLATRSDHERVQWTANRGRSFFPSLPLQRDLVALRLEFDDLIHPLEERTGPHEELPVRDEVDEVPGHRFPLRPVLVFFITKSSATYLRASVSEG